MTDERYQRTGHVRTLYETRLNRREKIYCARFFFFFFFLARDAGSLYSPASMLQSHPPIPDWTGLPIVAPLPS